MWTSRALRLASALVLVAAVLAPTAPSAAPSDAPASAASPPPGPAPSAGPSGDAAGSLEADPPGPEKSPVPTSKEWLVATPLALSRVSPAAAGCVATRVREWVRVRCAGKTFAISLLGGSNEGLSFWIGPEERGQPGEVQFPVRRGDRRVVQLWAYGTDAEGGVVPSPWLVLQEQWVEGESAPTITVL